MTRIEPDRPRRKYAPRLPPAQRREQLLDAAFEVTRRHGLHDLSMESVAQEAGVGKPVLYTVFRTRADLVAALLEREHGRAVEQVIASMPTDLTVSGPAAAYAATVTAFVDAVLSDPTRWRLILTAPDTAPGEYRDHLRSARSAILRRAVELAHAGVALEPALAGLDEELLAHTMLSVAEMLGRLAVGDPDTFTRERLATYASALAGMIAVPSAGSD
ncbi:TetR/AcrR family transcriptional regulator [Rhodococcus triatomae]|nr:TetR family transcriptional regulator [Rhodococcus triatomae BKS 15-14]